MFKERGRVRVKATGLYGTIVDWRSDSDRCEVELDGWQRNVMPDEDDLLLRMFSLSDLDELVEVSNAERKAVFESFDMLVISAYQQRAFLGSPVVVIRREGDAVRVSVIAGTLVGASRRKRFSLSKARMCRSCCLRSLRLMRIGGSSDSGQIVAFLMGIHGR